MASRKDVEEFIIKYIDKLIPDGHNKQLYIDMFKRMSDKDFKQFMSDLENGNTHLSVITPNYSKKSKLDLKRNLSIAKELKHDFFQKLWIGPTDNTPRYLTPIKYMVVDLPFRRAAQTISKKISIPENDKHVDYLTYQPTGKSKGSKISYPEIQVLAAQELDNTLVELLKFRGGDKQGYRALNIMLARKGMATQKVLEQFSSGVESTKTLKTFLTAMHLKNNLI